MKTLAYLGVVLCLLASGCEDTKNPLCDPQTAKPDTKLFGVWRQSNAEGDEIYHVGSAGDEYPKGIMRIVVVEHNKGKLEPPEEYLAFPALIGGKTYLNVVWDTKLVRQMDEKGWKAAAVTSYAILKYQFDGDKLVVFPIDEEAKTKAVKDGKVQGTEKNNTATFTDSTESVARFVAAADAGLWNTKDAGRFERVNLGKKP